MKVRTNIRTGKNFLEMLHFTKVVSMNSVPEMSYLDFFGHLSLTAEFLCSQLGLQNNDATAVNLFMNYTTKNKGSLSTTLQLCFYEAVNACTFFDRCQQHEVEITSAMSKEEVEVFRKTMNLYHQHKAGFLSALGLKQDGTAKFGHFVNHCIHQINPNWIMPCLSLFKSDQCLMKMLMGNNSTRVAAGDFRFDKTAYTICNVLSDMRDTSIATQVFSGYPNCTGIASRLSAVNNTNLIEFAVALGYASMAHHARVSNELKKTLHWTCEETPPFHLHGTKKDVRLATQLTNFLTYAKDKKGIDTIVECCTGALTIFMDNYRLFAGSKMTWQLNDYDLYKVNVYKSLKEQPYQLIAECWRIIHNAGTYQGNYKGFLNYLDNGITSHTAHDTHCKAAAFYMARHVSSKADRPLTSSDNPVTLNKHLQDFVKVVNNVLRFHIALNTVNTVITQQSVIDIPENSHKSDFLLVDPPYPDTESYSTSGKTFTIEDHQALDEALRRTDSQFVLCGRSTKRTKKKGEDKQTTDAKTKQGVFLLDDNKLSNFYVDEFCKKSTRKHYYKLISMNDGKYDHKATEIMITNFKYEGFSLLKRKSDLSGEAAMAS